MLKRGSHVLIETEILRQTPMHLLASTVWSHGSTPTSSTGLARSQRTTLLRVPFTLVLKAANILLNPAHADVATFTSEVQTDVQLDPRLFIMDG